MEVDYIIVGQGLAGSLMACELINRGKKIVVYDLPHENHSSQVAAGLFNPITGRRFVKTWKADTLFPFLHTHYLGLEQQLGARFFYRLPLFRPFISVEEQNDIALAMSDPGLEKYFIKVTEEDPDLKIKNPYGGAYIRSAGFLNIPVFITSVQTLIRKKAVYRAEHFDEEKLELKPGRIHYKDIHSGKILFCNGLSVSNSRFFGWLPFRPVKGELIFVTIDPPFEFIYNRNVFILPYKGSIHKVGSTYDWENIDINPSEEAKTTLENKLNRSIDVNSKTIEQVAGIRPATKDRRPFIGKHPEHKNMGIFNGLGSKGVSLGPYFAGKLIDCMENNAEIDFEANIKRYISLY